jgi:DNA-binding NarL/FixJ family response regulator
MNDLSSRELEVLREMATGVSRRVAGAHLGISEKTVSAHLRNAFQRLHVGSLVHAFVVLGWLKP